MRLKDKICVITGASSGIGEACMVAMEKEGGIVIGIARRGSDNPRLPIIPTDVTDEKNIQKAVDIIIKKHNRIDVLILSAGISYKGSLVTTPTDMWDKLFNVNVKGTYLTLRAVIPHMQKQEKGSIVIISSNYGIVGGRNYAAYSATKGATLILSKTLALDLASDNIRVNCVAPGTIETPMVLEPMKKLTPQQIEETNARRRMQHPIGRIGKPEEVASGVVYLASDEASFVTGAVLCVDGGFTAQ